MDLESTTRIVVFFFSTFFSTSNRCARVIGKGIAGMVGFLEGHP